MTAGFLRSKQSQNERVHIVELCVRGHGRSGVLWIRELPSEERTVNAFYSGEFHMAFTSTSNGLPLFGS